MGLGGRLVPGVESGAAQYYTLPTKEHTGTGTAWGAGAEFDRGKKKEIAL